MSNREAAGLARRTTGISWCTNTENYQAGCRRVSPACGVGYGANAKGGCYAERDSNRFAHSERAPSRYKGGVVKDGRWTGEVAWDMEKLPRIFQGIRAARKSRRTWVGSMTDLWLESIPLDGPSLAGLASEIRATFTPFPLARCRADQVLILLTKRPQRLLDWQKLHFPEGLPPGVEVGTTAEDQRRANQRVPVLLEVDAQIRFLSCEPLLGPVDLKNIPYTKDGARMVLNALTGEVLLKGWHHWRGNRINMLIAGGESGLRARPSHPDWFRMLRRDCLKADTIFHFKQWGEWAEAAPEARGADGQRHATRDPDSEDGQARWTRRSRGISYSGQIAKSLDDMEPGVRYHHVIRVGKPQAGQLLDGAEHLAVPAFPGWLTGRS